jgi:hypothetical protein
MGMASPRCHEDSLNQAQSGVRRLWTQEVADPIGRMSQYPLHFKMERDTRGHINLGAGNSLSSHRRISKKTEPLRRVYLHGGRHPMQAFTDQRRYMAWISMFYRRIARGPHSGESTRSDESPIALRSHRSMHGSNSARRIPPTLLGFCLIPPRSNMLLTHDSTLGPVHDVGSSQRGTTHG